MNKPILILVLAMFLIALGGGLLHYRIHQPFVDNPAPEHQPGQEIIVSVGKKFSLPHGLASVFSLLDIVLITALFCSRKTAGYGFLFKGLFAIFGIILMGHFSISALSKSNPGFSDWIFRSTLPDILVVLGGFFIGKAIYDSYPGKDRG